MKSIVFWFFLIFLCLNLSGNRATAQTHDLLTNTSVVKLVKADFKEKTIIAIIGSSPTRFDLSTERMIELKKSGVSEKVILAMLARQLGLINKVTRDRTHLRPPATAPTFLVPAAAFMATRKAEAAMVPRPAILLLPARQLFVSCGHPAKPALP